MERQYLDGDYIFREGEAGLSAFIIKSGAVELFKQGPHGPVHLARLGKNELFGEMSALDKSPRSASARAHGPVTLTILPRNEFLQKITSDPEMALRVVGKLVERLRATDEMLVAHQVVRTKQEEDNARQTVTKNESSLLDRLFGWGSSASSTSTPEGKKKKKTAKIKPIDHGPLTVVVSPLVGDEGGALRKMILDVLGGLAGIKISATSKTPFTSFSGDPEHDLREAFKTSRAVASHAKANLLLWGGLDHGGKLLHVRFSAGEASHDDRPGVFMPQLALSLPLNPTTHGLDDPWRALLRSALLAAVEPHTEQQCGDILSALTAELEKAAYGATENVPGLTGVEQASIYTAFANALAAAGILDHGEHFFERAIDVYRKAIRHLPDKTAWEWGELHRLLGLTIQALAERTNDPDLMERAASAFDTAATVLTREADPAVWGGIQNRLGTLFYKIDLKTASTKALKQSLTAYQGALQVITKDGDPERWADIMNNLAQTLQLYGEQIGSAEIIRRAADYCRAALEIRDEEGTPLLWAATQNNLGSALFLLSKYVGGAECLEEAVDAFQKALNLYEAVGAVKMAAITEKNLHHAESHLRLRKDKGGAGPSWADKED